MMGCASSCSTAGRGCTVPSQTGHKWGGEAGHGGLSTAVQHCRQCAQAACVPGGTVRMEARGEG